MRRMRAKMLWKVPIQRSEAFSGETRVAIRSRISRAALLVKVRAKMFQGCMPCSSR